MLVRMLCAMAFTISMIVEPALAQDAVKPQIANASAQSSHIPSQPLTAQLAEAPETLIGGGDLLRVSVFGVKDFDEDARVSVRGIVSLPLIGEVHISGLTTDEAEAVIERRLIEGDFMLHPEVSVFVKEYANQGVSVLGEVEKPGVYSLLGAHGLFEVLSMAGGLTPKSGPTLTIQHRDRPNDPVQISLAEIGKSATADTEILPGDTVFVSKAGLVYVVGDVKNPSGVVIENGSDMTVLKAVALAGGANSTAAINGAKLIRRTPDGPVETSIPLKKIFAAKLPDLKLQAEDIVFVPNSSTKSVGRRGVEAILQVATGVAIYRTP